MDDIACRFIEAMYNGESFLVRHANVTAADEPYDRLERAIFADTDEEACESL